MKSYTRRTFVFSTGVKIDLEYDDQNDCWMALRNLRSEAGSQVLGMGETKRLALQSLRKNIALKIANRIKEKPQVWRDGMAVDENGNMFAWGSNPHGQLGHGNTVAKSSPVLVVGGLKFQNLNQGLKK